MKTLAQSYRESMRFFAKMWREYHCADDLKLAISCRDQARAWSGKAAR